MAQVQKPGRVENNPKVSKFQFCEIRRLAVSTASGSDVALTTVRGIGFPTALYCSFPRKL
jgi:hypothetical protein